MDCHFTLKFKESLDGQGLFLFNMNSDHNHEVNESEFKFAPKQNTIGKEFLQGIMKGSYWERNVLSVCLRT